MLSLVKVWTPPDHLTHFLTIVLYVVAGDGCNQMTCKACQTIYCYVSFESPSIHSGAKRSNLLQICGSDQTGRGDVHWKSPETGCPRWWHPHEMRAFWDNRESDRALFDGRDFEELRPVPSKFEADAKHVAELDFDVRIRRSNSLNVSNPLRRQYERISEYYLVAEAFNVFLS